MWPSVGVERDEVASFRYRGNGNPGPTRVETSDGRSFELTYQEMWEDEATWQIQTRCKICHDATGEGADIAASDACGEDEGFNGIIVRTTRGLELYRDAVAAGAIVIDAQPIVFRDLQDKRFISGWLGKTPKSVAVSRRFGRVVPGS